VHDLLNARIVLEGSPPVRPTHLIALSTNGKLISVTRLIENIEEKNGVCFVLKNDENLLCHLSLLIPHGPENHILTRMIENKVSYRSAREQE
jgi:hypothetical protein